MASERMDVLGFSWKLLPNSLCLKRNFSSRIFRSSYSRDNDLLSHRDGAMGPWLQLSSTKRYGASAVVIGASALVRLSAVGVVQCRRTQRGHHESYRYGFINTLAIRRSSSQYLRQLGPCLDTKVTQGSRRCAAQVAHQRKNSNRALQFSNIDLKLFIFKYFMLTQV